MLLEWRSVEPKFDAVAQFNVLTVLELGLPALGIDRDALCSVLTVVEWASVVKALASVRCGGFAPSALAALRWVLTLTIFELLRGVSLVSHGSSVSTSYRTTSCVAHTLHVPLHAIHEFVKMRVCVMPWRVQRQI